MDINFRAKYLSRNEIINDIVGYYNNNLQIRMFYFFENNRLLYIKKMAYNCNNYNYYRISNLVLNLFYEKQYKIPYLYFIILLTDTYINEDRKLIYMNTYKNNSFHTFIIGDYYKSHSREYINYYHHIYYRKTVGDFYYYNNYITKQEINDIQEQLKTCSKSIELLCIL